MCICIYIQAAGVDLKALLAALPKGGAPTTETALDVLSLRGEA